MKHFRNVSLKDHCTYRIGGTARNFYVPENMEEMADLVRSLRASGESFWIHGGGANTLFPDGEIELPVVSTRAMTASRRDGQRLSAESGRIMDVWVLEALRAGLGGVECLSGIPGTLGGALFMNAGAYGQEISDHLQAVTVLDQNGRVAEIPRAQCGFGYRRADALRDKIILAGTWDLPVAESSAVLAARREILARRRERQPLEFPSAGSVFKRPEGAFASRLIDEAGLKGARVGGAQVSEKHAGFIVNTGGATCRDVLDLIELCRRTVRERFGHDLELEQRLCPSCSHTPQEAS